MFLFAQRECVSNSYLRVEVALIGRTRPNLEVPSNLLWINCVWKEVTLAGIKRRSPRTKIFTKRTVFHWASRPWLFQFLSSKFFYQLGNASNLSRYFYFTPFLHFRSNASKDTLTSTFCRQSLQTQSDNQSVIDCHDWLRKQTQQRQVLASI